MLTATIAVFLIGIVAVYIILTTSRKCCTGESAREATPEGHVIPTYMLPEGERPQPEERDTPSYWSYYDENTQRFGTRPKLQLGVLAGGPPCNDKLRQFHPNVITDEQHPSRSWAAHHSAGRSCLVAPSGESVWLKR